MYLPKSSNDLNALPSARRTSRRNSKGVRCSKQMKEWEFKISNPFRNPNQQNLLPPNYIPEIQQMEYISSRSIKNIQMPQTRRVSGFQKNLQIMQQMARRQEQKYTGLMREESVAPSRKNNAQIQQFVPFSMNEDDEVSLEINGFFDYRERVEDDFNIFENGGVNEMGNEEPVMFYSNQEIQLDQMNEEVNNYFR